MPPLGVIPGAFATAFGVFAAALGLFAAVHALLHKRRPQSAFGWIAVCLTLPVAGAVLYFLFGVNRVETRARVLLGGKSPAFLKSLSDEARQPPLLPGNAVEALHNGERAFPAMLDAIRSAQSRVYLASYIFDSSDVGRAFVAALGDAAARGVEVRVLLDGIGELYSLPRAGALLRSRGVRFARFLPPRIVPPTLRINLRNHRKILAVDGTVAFAGGINIAKRHLADDVTNPQRVVDLHFRLEGPVAAQLENVFVEDWYFAARERLPPAQAAPAPSGGALCRVVADGPYDNADPLTALLLRTVGGATKRIAIMTPYFLPPPELIGTLQAAALRGVDVAVVLPAKNNLPYVHRATRHMLWQLLQRNVKVYYQPPPFVHTKMLLVDDDCALVGSWNIDPRSLRLNFELAVEIHAAAVAARLGAHFDAARARSAAVTLADVDGRPLPTRLVDAVAWLFSPYL